ncbi:N-lysine methyltransferase setd6 [Hondaea fermentalgiana]|uniref:N-lysine methyltransferase setd6 n=1 Tax=Hondaea fermentalgiana TaxID=2315210 RepID=A0A2R5GUN5_9STRA|nr:N-lysine methyltransferase setd6 [Hondaea fermentalgiana]|eukprot:GBG33468.1 N-lysine methyltransferase setd6 [Hondaea fermentalgiana]
MTTQRVKALEAFLEQRGASWARGKVEMTTEGVVHGFGVVAKSTIAEGEEIFRIPREAAFGAGLLAGTSENERDDNNENGDEDEVEHRDSQMSHALLLLAERAKGSETSPWAPLWATLPEPSTYEDLPWLWPAERGEAVKGTALELPIANKKTRIEEEWKALVARGETSVDLESYAHACGVILSHLNPFFGGAVVPFVYMLNCSNTNEPNVEFESEETEEGDEVVVGRAICDIAAGEELTQAYGNDISNAELVYRCGFALPQAELRDVVDVGYASEVQAGKERIQEVNLLQRAGVIAACAWDGLEDVLTIEVSKDSGLTELRVACAVRGLDDATLAKFCEYCGLSGAEASPLSAGKAAGLSVKKQRLDEMDCVAVLLCACLDAVERGEWPPSTAKSHAAMLGAARKSEAIKDDEDEDDEDDEDEDEDEVLWDVLRPVLASKAVQHATEVLRTRMARIEASASARSGEVAMEQLAAAETKLLNSVLQRT